MSCRPVKNWEWYLASGHRRERRRAYEAALSVYRWVEKQDRLAKRRHHLLTIIRLTRRQRIRRWLRGLQWKRWIAAVCFLCGSIVGHVALGTSERVLLLAVGMTIGALIGAYLGDWLRERYDFRAPVVRK